MDIIWKANRNHYRGTPVRWPPGPRLGDSWWNREETNLPHPVLYRTFMYEFEAAEAERSGEPPGWGEKNQLLLWKRQPEKN